MTWLATIKCDKKYQNCNYPIWSSGQDTRLSPERLGFDSRYGSNFKYTDQDQLWLTSVIVNVYCIPMLSSGQDTRLSPGRPGFDSRHGSLYFLNNKYSFYVKNDCRNPGSNQGPLDLQSNALPTELFRLVYTELYDHINFADLAL